MLLFSSTVVEKTFYKKMVIGQAAKSSGTSLADTGAMAA